MRKVKFKSNIGSTEFIDCDDDMYLKIKDLDKVKIKFNIQGQELEMLCDIIFENEVNNV